MILIATYIFTHLSRFQRYLEMVGLNNPSQQGTVISVKMIKVNDIYSYVVACRMYI